MRVTLRNSLAALAVGATCFLGGVLYSNHRAAARAAIALSDWTAKLERVEKLNQDLMDRNLKILAANSILEARNEDIERERELLVVQLADSNNALQWLRDHEPSQPELETQPLVLNLRAQILEGDKRYSLAIADIAKANEEIANQKIQLTGLEQAYHNALLMYANDNMLLGTATVSIARLSRQNATIKTVAKAEGIVIIVLTIIALVK